MAPYATFTDEQLIPLLRQGDGNAFEEVYGRYFKITYGFLLKFLKSSELTEDLSQEVFMKLWDGREHLPQLLSVKSYLLTIAKNHAFNFLKRAGVDQNAKAEILKHYPTNGNSLENVVHFNDYKRYLDELLATLTPQSRKVFPFVQAGG